MLSIIIINYNTRILTARLIDSLAEHVLTSDSELIIVDNGSSDGSAECFSSHYPGARVIRLDSNVGFASAVNRAVVECAGEYIWLINSDCHVNSDVSSVMLSYLASHSQTAAVTGRLVSPDGAFQASCRRFPSFGNILFSRQSPLGMLSNSSHRYTLPDYDTATPVDSCAATNMLIRRECFDAVGGFDERFFMYCEDTDICLRFAERGWNIVYLPEAEVVHEWAASWKDAGWMRYYHHHRSLCRYFRKHFSGETLKLCVLELLLVVGLGIRMAVSTLARCLKS